MMCILKVARTTFVGLKNFLIKKKPPSDRGKLIRGRLRSLASLDKFLWTLPASCKLLMPTRAVQRLQTLVKYNHRELRKRVSACSYLRSD